MPAQSPYHDPEVIRALYVAVERLKGSVPNRSARPSCERAGKPWGRVEETHLIQELERGKSIARIANAHRRTRGAILSRLIRLGRFLSWRKAPARVPSHRVAVRDDWSRLKLERKRAGRIWSGKEDASLLSDFEAGRTLPDIASRLGRGVHAVEVRLFKLGKIGDLVTDAATPK